MLLLLDFLLCSLVIIIYLLIAGLSIIAIQYLGLRIFKFNLFRKFIRFLLDTEKRLKETGWC